MLGWVGGRCCLGSRAATLSFPAPGWILNIVGARGPCCPVEFTPPCSGSCVPGARATTPDCRGLTGQGAPALPLAAAGGARQPLQEARGPGVLHPALPPQRPRAPHPARPGPAPPAPGHRHGRTRGAAPPAATATTACRTWPSPRQPRDAAPAALPRQTWDATRSLSSQQSPGRCPRPCRYGNPQVVTLDPAVMETPGLHCGPEPRDPDLGSSAQPVTQSPAPQPQHLAPEVRG